MINKNKLLNSDTNKDRLVCEKTYELLRTLKKLGLKFNVPMREILAPLSLDGVMLDRFYKAFIRTDDDK